jgi:hypothetical protein
MIALAIVGIVLAGLLGFAIGVVSQSKNGPDYDEYE